VDAPESVDAGAWFEAHFDYVWHTLRRLGVRPADLEDVAHDVFLLVHRHADRYDRGRPVKPWLFGFAFRIASDYRHKAAHRREAPASTSDPLEATEPAPSALDRLVQREEIALAHAALETLDLDRRAVFILHELDGCPVPEVAAALASPINTAYSRLRAARQKFAASVRRLRKGER
jgi:RNA polymerase sigma-70 factor (ECF subfamily)